MSGGEILVGLAGVLFAAAPIVIAAMGETLAERAGVVNLSLNGTILLSAMGSFAAAVRTDSLLAGFAAGAAIGALLALVIAFSRITLRQSQVAVGFVLALVGRDLAYFLGDPFMGLPGPRLGSCPVPGLERVPVLGPLFFQQDGVTYASFALVLAAWFWVSRTRAGLILRGLGENPAASYARGVNVGLQRYAYTLAGGALAGVAGAAYSLSVKAGWKGTMSGLDGVGWVVLAVTIFGGWNPVRVAFGAYLFALLQWLGLVLQPGLPDVPSQVLQVAPFPLMILTLLFVNLGNTEWVARMLAALPPRARARAAGLLRRLQASPPAALGAEFRGGA